MIEVQDSAVSAREQSDEALYSPSDYGLSTDVQHAEQVAGARGGLQGPRVGHRRQRVPGRGHVKGFVRRPSNVLSRA
ncbi:MAG: hypothetical protein QOG28_3708 [Trebonia sp.]|jgi:hypothetical protein|nr:hypothetical protein [Trebonia sp.]